MQEYHGIYRNITEFDKNDEFELVVFISFYKQR